MNFIGLIILYMSAIMNIGKSELSKNTPDNSMDLVLFRQWGLTKKI